MTAQAHRIIRSPYAGLVPEEAAGRDDLFFFGTLMHLEVLKAVLAREVGPAETGGAVLMGYRRERAAEASYPVLVPDPRGAVEGLLLRRPSRRDIRRVNHFEDDEYEARHLPVTTRGGRRHAWVFMALEHVAMMRPSGEPWELERWAEAHLAGYHAAIRGWMANAPDD